MQKTKMGLVLLGLVGVLGACTTGTITQAQLSNDIAVASTVSCAVNSGVAVGLAVDSSIDTTKAAATTNAKIANAANALCAGVSAAAKQVIAATPPTGAAQ